MPLHCAEMLPITLLLCFAIRSAMEKTPIGKYMIIGNNYQFKAK